MTNGAIPHLLLLSILSRKIIPSNYYDGDDYYQVGLVGDKVVL